MYRLETEGQHPIQVKDRSERRPTAFLRPMVEDIVRRIEVAQIRIERARSLARQVMMRQEERMQESRRTIEWASGQRDS
jgi:hypothetical protein